MTKPFNHHQVAISRWQPSARIFGRTLWRALVRHAVDRDTDERRGRAPVSAVIPPPFFGPNQYGAWMAVVIRNRPMLRWGWSAS